MPLFRIIVEGSGVRTWAGAAGFFCSRTVTQPTREAAEMLVLRTIREDWRQGPSANLSPTKPALAVIDGWALGLIDRMKRTPDTSYRFYAADDRTAVAAAEAAHANAPKASPIWTIATQDNDAASTPAHNPGAALVRRR